MNNVSKFILVRYVTNLIEKMKNIILILALCVLSVSAFAECFGTGCLDNNGNTTNIEGRDAIGIRWNGNPAIIEALIKAGADINTRNEFGQTPLMVAATSNKNPAIIEALIKAGADINARDKGGMTSLMAAAMSNKNPAIIETLIKAGADVNTRNGMVGHR